ncbi:MAG: addiction module protein [Planctomycetes bacterium]|nr:addiction module protein [Planctomycetota bacterium]
MSRNAQSLLEEALRLPDDQRANMVAELLRSLPPPQASHDRSNEEWIAEIERRARRGMAGEHAIPWHEVRERAEAKLRRE